MSAPGSGRQWAPPRRCPHSARLEYGKTFFDERQRHQFSCPDSQGRPIVVGTPAVTTTDVGGCICDADTDIVGQWVWRKRDGQRTPLRCGWGRRIP